MNHMLAATTDIHADRLTHTAHFHAVSLTSAHYSKQLATLRNVDKRNSRVAAAVAAGAVSGHLDRGGYRGLGDAADVRTAVGGYGGCGSTGSLNTPVTWILGDGAMSKLQTAIYYAHVV
jgi:hypothetical protein